MKKLARSSGISLFFIGIFFFQAVAGTRELYRVHKGDTLWHIAERSYGDPYRWLDLWRNNPHIQNPDRIYPGDCLILRGAELSKNIYVIRKGDTLSWIAREVYGDPSRWRELWKKNPHLEDPNKIYPWDHLVVYEVEKRTEEGSLPPDCGEGTVGEVQVGVLEEAVKTPKRMGWLPDADNKGWGLRRGSIAIGALRTENDIDFENFSDRGGNFDSTAGYRGFYAEIETFFLKRWALELGFHQGYPDFKLVDTTTGTATLLDAKVTEVQALLKYEFSLLSVQGRSLTLLPKIGFEWFDFSIDDQPTALLFVPDHSLKGLGIGGEADIPMHRRFSLFLSLLYFPFLDYSEEPKVSGEEGLGGLNAQFDLGIRLWILDPLIAEFSIQQTNFLTEFHNGARKGVSFNRAGLEEVYRMGRFGLRWSF